MANDAKIHWMNWTKMGKSKLNGGYDLDFKTYRTSIRH
jgi:hypothetical protein